MVLSRVSPFCCLPWWRKFGKASKYESFPTKKHFSAGKHLPPGKSFSSGNTLKQEITSQLRNTSQLEYASQLPIYDILSIWETPLCWDRFLAGIYVLVWKPLQVLKPIPGWKWFLFGNRLPTGKHLMLSQHAVAKVVQNNASWNLSDIENMSNFTHFLGKEFCIRKCPFWKIIWGLCKICIPVPRPPSKRLKGSPSKATYFMNSYNI